MPALEKGTRIKYPGRYTFQLDNHPPKEIVKGLIVRLEGECKSIHQVVFDPAYLSDRGDTLVLPMIDIGLWLPSTYPRLPESSVLDWHGLLSELTFKEDQNMLDGSDRSWVWEVEDRGSLRFLNNKLEFTDPYPERNAKIHLSLRGSLPDLTRYEPEPETVKPTMVWVNLVGETPGPLVQAALGYINEISQHVGIEADINRDHGRGGYTIYEGK